MADELKTQEAADKYRAEAAGAIWGDNAQVEATPVSAEELVKPEPDDEEAIIAGGEIEVDEVEEEEVDDEVNPLEDLAQNVKQLTETIGGIDYRIKQTERRVGSLQNEIQNQASAAKTAAAQVDDSPSEEETKAALVDDEKWEKLKEEYPEWSDVMEAIGDRYAVKDAAPPFQEALERERDKLQTDFDKKLSDQQLKNEIRFVAFAHPDWEKIDNSDEFRDWLIKQPEDVKAKSTSSNGLDIINVLDSYKESLKPEDKGDEKNPEEIVEKRKRRLARSVEVKKKNKPIKTKSLDDMTEDELRAHYAKNWDDL